MDNFEAKRSEAEQDYSGFLHGLNRKAKLGLTDEDIRILTVFPVTKRTGSTELYYTSTLSSMLTATSSASPHQFHEDSSQGQVGSVQGHSSKPGITQEHKQCAQLSCTSTLFSRSTETSPASSHQLHGDSSQGQVGSVGCHICKPRIAQEHQQYAHLSCTSTLSSRSPATLPASSHQLHGNSPQGQVGTVECKSRKPGIRQEHGFRVIPKNSNAERTGNTKRPEGCPVHNYPKECCSILLSLEQHVYFKHNTEITKIFESLNAYLGDLGCLARPVAVHILPNEPEIHVNCAEMDFAFVMRTIACRLRLYCLFGPKKDQDSKKKTSNEKKLHGNVIAPKQ